MNQALIEAFWQVYLATLPEGHPHHQANYTAWGFGDSAAMHDELGQLVKQGLKTATASAIWEYEDNNEPMPQVGDLSIILDGEEKPMCIIETIELRTLLFHEVDAQFAYDEGEDDRTLDSWRKAHQAFFTRSLKAHGREFSENMPVLCERFRLIYNP